MKKHIILFLATNLSGLDRREFEQEARSVQMELERSGYRNCFEFLTRWAVEPLDLLRELRKLKPTIVHFRGQGGWNVTGDYLSGEVTRRDAAGDLRRTEQHGLFFQAAGGGARLVSIVALDKTFGAAGASVKLVVLDACYSEPQAEALLAHVDCVVGTDGSIHDDAARSFAIGFYGGLGEGESVATACEQGRAAISLEGLRDGDMPQLKVRAGIDAFQVVLAADPQQPRADRHARRSHSTSK